MTSFRVAAVLPFHNYLAYSGKLAIPQPTEQKLHLKSCHSLFLDGNLEKSHRREQGLMGVAFGKGLGDWLQMPSSVDLP